MTATVLIIEDEADIRKFLRQSLKTAGFLTLEAETARDGLHRLISQRPDVILLDLGLPDQDGQAFIRDIREWTKVPLIVLSARNEESDKIEALENGADDYLTKPFAVGELIARLKVAQRHATAADLAGVAVFQSDGLVLDLAARRVSLDGQDIHLTPIEYKLLVLLTRHAGKVLTHTQMLKEVWGGQTAVQNHYLRIHTQHLREKLKDDPLSPRFIMTEPGIGYRFKARS